MIIKPEARILLDCLNLNSGDAVASRLMQLTAAQWNEIVCISKSHWVTPLLYHRLKSRRLDKYVPSDVAERLYDIYLRSAGRNIRKFHELSVVLDVLHNDNIPVIVLKGSHLAEIIYGNIALRPMYDTDIMIRREDLQNVEDKLLKLGYVAHKDNLRKHEGHYHSVFVNMRGGTNVEVHWHIHRPSSLYDIDVNDLWRRAQTVELTGRRVMVISPEDFLIYQCTHACKHLFMQAGLLELNDVYETINFYNGELDWDVFLERTMQWRALNSVYLTLRLANELLAAEVPEYLINMFKSDDLNCRIMDGAKEYIFNEEIDVNEMSANVAKLRELGKPGDKINLFLKVVFPSTGEMIHRYSIAPGSMKLYFYYVKRVLELVKKHSGDVWKLIWREPEAMELAGRVNNRTALRDWIHHTNIDEEVERLELCRDKTI